MTKILIIAVILIIVAAGLYMEFQRSGNLSNSAKQLGLSFRSGVQPLPDDIAAANFDLFTQGGPQVHNLMAGSLEGDSITVFDYSYDAVISGEGFGQLPVADDQTNVETRSQTVVVLQLRQVLPEFDLSPKKAHMRKVASRFGFHQLSLEQAAPFADQYHLLVKDDDRCRALFDAELREVLSGKRWFVESRGEQLLLYRIMKRAKASELSALLDEVRQIKSALN